MTGSEDTTARVWDLQACSIDAVPRHHSRVVDLAATSDGKVAVSLGARSPG